MGDNEYNPPIPGVDEREAKLPAWAKRLIGDLRRTAADAVDFAQQLQSKTDPDGSSVLLDPHSGSGKTIGLDDPIAGRAWRREIGFRVPAPGYRDGGALLSVSLLRNGSGIEVRGSSAICVEPQVSNVVKIYHAERG